MNRVGAKFGSNKCVTVVDNYTFPCVKSDTSKLSPFQDNDDINLGDVCDCDIPALDVTTIRVIAALCFSLDFSEESTTSDVIKTIINSVTLQAITPAEQALGKFTSQKLKNMDTWDNWITG